ncbi:histidine kinase dimerization/phospho-acceptor domain-containing protein, partial [Burkholderia sola]|uniref:histidine kinase dimerization/phospho-acceptor domain-containing protein n=1 Tax=Burkholderia sola TaxID=2843302 RepID=UPI003390089B
RSRLEGRDYIEGCVRALTHELKSPVAAIRGAGELLQEDLPPADRELFARQVVDQCQRLQNLVDQLLRLSQLEQRRALLATAQRDPLNPKVFPQPPKSPQGGFIDAFQGASVLELPKAPPQPWVAPRAGVAQGALVQHRLSSRVL